MDSDLDLTEVEKEGVWTMSNANETSIFNDTEITMPSHLVDTSCDATDKSVTFWANNTIKRATIVVTWRQKRPTRRDLSNLEAAIEFNSGSPAVIINIIDLNS